MNILKKVANESRGQQRRGTCSCRLAYLALEIALAGGCSHLYWCPGWYHQRLAGAFNNSGRVDATVYDLAGKLFMNALKLLVVPLIGLSMLSSIASIKGESGVGRMGLRTVLLYALTSLIAICIGLAIVNIIQPGNHSSITGDQVEAELAREGSQSAAKLSSLEASTSGASMSDILVVFESIIPANIFSAAAKGNLLGVIFFAVLFGFAIQRLPDSAAKTNFIGILDVAYQAMMAVTHMVLRFLPLGVLALVALTVAEAVSNGDLVDYIWALFAFVFAVVLALALHVFTP